MTKRVAFVTGGNGGIGSSICSELAKQGHTVVAGYFPPEKESAEAWQKQMHDDGISIGLAAVDVSSFEDCERAVKEIAGEFGTVDILVNCAGITRDGTLKKMPEENWSAVMSTNLDSQRYPACHQRHVEQRLGPHRQHRLGERSARSVRSGKLLGCEGRYARIHDGCRAGNGRERHYS